MKWLVLVIILCIQLPFSFAQNKKEGIQAAYKYRQIREKYIPLTDISPPDFLPIENKSPLFNVSRSRSVFEEIIGTTGYHLQTNASTRNSVVRLSDSSVSAVWTMSAQLSSWSDRGTGYNQVINGSALPSPVSRIEGATRTGWPSIAVTASGKEIIATHTGAGLRISTKNLSNGTWSPIFVGTSVTTATWPRIVASNSSVHVICQGTGSSGIKLFGQKGPLLYSRSLNEGNTWDKEMIQLPLSDSTYSLGWGGDNYSIDAFGNYVAIVAGDLDDNVTLFKSNDNGDTWTRTVIMQFPIPLYNKDSAITDINNDGIADTLDSNAGDVTVRIDNYGMAHVSFSMARVLNDDVQNGLNYFPGVAGLYYWKETFGANSPYLLQNAYLDYNGNGEIDLPETGLATNQNPWGTYSGSGLIAHPSISFDQYNNVLLAYDAIAESADTSIFHQAFRHVFIHRLYMSDMGIIEMDFPTDIVPATAAGGDGEYQEAVWPSISRSHTLSCYLDQCSIDPIIVYYRDPAPGIQNVSGTPRDPDASNNASIISDVVCSYWVESVAGPLLTNIIELSKENVFPVPASDFVNIKLTEPINNKAYIDIYDTVGKLLKHSEIIINGNMIRLDLTEFKTGIYNASVMYNNKLENVRFVVKK